MAQQEILLSWPCLLLFVTPVGLAAGILKWSAIWVFSLVSHPALYWYWFTIWRGHHLYQIYPGM